MQSGFNINVAVELGGSFSCDYGFADRQVDDRRHRSQRRVGVPHDVVVPEVGHGEAAEPCAEEAADLVREQR